jgi:hypothetical protein
MNMRRLGRLPFVREEIVPQATAAEHNWHNHSELEVLLPLMPAAEASTAGFH